MIQVPVPPKTLATRQITCICCHEQFTISVDRSANERDDKSRRWHIPVPQRSQMQYVGQRQRRLVSPAATVDPEPISERRPHRNPTHYYFVNCPRCGADNRNWLKFEQQKFPRQKSLIFGCVLAGSVTLSMLVLSIVNPDFLTQMQINKWTRSIPLILTVLLAGFLPLILIPDQWDKMRLRKYEVEVIPSIKGSWSPATLQSVYVLVGLALLLPIIIYVLLPILHQVKGAVSGGGPEPTLVARIDEVVRQTDKLAILADQQSVNNAFGGLTAVLNTQLRTCEKTQIDQMIADLQAIAATSPHGNLLLIQSATNQLQVIREMADVTCRVELINNVNATLQPIIPVTTSNQPLPNTLTPEQCRSQWQAANEGQNVIVDPACYNFLLTTMLIDLQRMQKTSLSAGSRDEILGGVRQLAADPNLLPSPRAQIESNIVTLENSLQSLAAPSQPWLNWRFLVFWFTVVSLTWLLCTICAFNAMNQRISWLDPHVPRPIFTSIAGMTRVAVWEAKHALEINDYEHRIQWTRAIRNEAGGIDLVGFFRDPPELLPDGTMSSQVRAQRYGVSTDMWCRIREARITDMMTQRPAGGPAFALPEFAPTTAVVTVGRERR